MRLVKRYGKKGAILKKIPCGYELIPQNMYSENLRRKRLLIIAFQVADLQLHPKIHISTPTHIQT